ncbi:MAG TPA: OmpA family protein [Bacteroidetes bacterium]|nr:OmpA family protein [Bacteroidota bacterium]
MLKNDSLLIFASVYSDSLIEEKAIEPGKKKNKNQFFKAVMTDGVWKGEGLYDDLMNSSEVDVANGALHLKSPYIYYTRCAIVSGKRKCDLYKIRKGGSEPAAILPEPINHSKYSTTQPALGTDKNGSLILYFVSDRDGGRGRTDIWYATYDSITNSFVNPQNAGSKINTRMDEATPFFEDRTRALYFSSNGWPGMGGFDIFKNIGSDKEWGEVKNVGYPLNSPADDLYYILNSKRDGGFLTSNRDGGFSIKHPNCCDDIYEFKQKAPVSSVLEVEVQGFETMLDSLGEPLVSLYLSSADSCVRLKDNKIVKELCDVLIKEIRLTEGNKCYFNISVGSEYEIKTYQSGSLAKSLKIKVSKEEYTDTLKAIIRLQEYSKDAIMIKNIYYEYKKFELTEASKLIIDSVLLKLLRDNPHIILEISAHTDSVGSFNYNYHLSQRRARSVVDYLVSNGIDPDQLKAQGYGELKPIVHNTNLDGTDNVEGRAMNRRTEFRIIGEIKGKLKPEYSR